MADFYTHKFVFKLDGNYIKGDIEFNTDDVASFHIKEISEPMNADILKSFYEYVVWCKGVYHEFATDTKHFEMTIKPKEL